MKLIRTIPSVVAALFGAAGCLAPECGETAAVSVKSPDGRNEIRLYEAPLRIEALRDGVTLVAPSRIGLKVNGACLAGERRHVALVDRTCADRVLAPVYRKSTVSLSRGETFADFGDWGVALVARNDGVAYRFETKFPGEITVDAERFDLAVPDPSAKCWANLTGSYGCEESIPQALPFGNLKTDAAGKVNGWEGSRYIYLPLAYETGGKTVAVTESDVFDYPVLNLVAPETAKGGVLAADLARWPKARERVGGWGNARNLASGGRWVKVRAFEDYLVKTAGTRTFPWRAFVIGDKPSDLPAADIVWALARPQIAGDDFAWVKPGKVAWDWWNCFDNGAGCNTKTYERFIDFAAKTGVEYVIFDEGWSESLNIWKFHGNVDVPHLIDYANKKGVGIILWMAWAQVCGEEEKVASHFAKLGAKGFKVDFMDRGDAECERFLWKFAEACRRNRMLVDYHGAHRPTGMSRAYPNVLNYEGIHGLEQMKWHKNNYDFMANDVRAAYLRMTAGPMDYTPGAMLNYPIGQYPNPCGDRPGSVGTRCRQMALMALYEAPLQMLCDSPTNYEKNEECFRFMAATPVVWKDTVALAGTPDTCIVLARQARDGAWYVAGITNRDARRVELDFSFLDQGAWQAECFRDTSACDRTPTAYLRETFDVDPGEKFPVWMAPGGGFVMRIVRK